MHEDGFAGLFSGMFRGAVGMITKPVAGVLDLASATSAAIRCVSHILYVEFD